MPLMYDVACNPGCFSLKCLKFDVIPVSIRLKTNVRTFKGLEIIRKAERKLLNEHMIYKQFLRTIHV